MNCLSYTGRAIAKGLSNLCKAIFELGKEATSSITSIDIKKIINDIRNWRQWREQWREWIHRQIVSEEPPELGEDRALPFQLVQTQETASNLFRNLKQSLHQDQSLVAFDNDHSSSVASEKEEIDEEEAEEKKNKKKQKRLESIINTLCKDILTCRQERNISANKHEIDLYDAQWGVVDSIAVNNN